MEEKSYFYMRLSNKKTVKLQQSCAMVTEKDLYDVQALKWWWNFEGISGYNLKNQNLVICADYINTTTKIKN